MYNNSYFKKMLVLASIIILYSCDKNYNEIGGNLIGDNHFGLTSYTSDVTAYNQKTGAVQSNNLAINALGVYVNPAFGTTTASFATQLSLDTEAPDIGANPVIESVVLTVPYFSTLKTTNTDGSHVYELDSIYGNINTAKIKLSVYESTFYMGGVDSDGLPLKYYTDQDFTKSASPSHLLAQNDQFSFDAAEHVENTTDPVTNVVTTTRTAPGIQLNLDKSIFTDRIINAPTGKLATNDVFKEHFRGLYFKVENVGSTGSMAMLNFKLGKITIKYKDALASGKSIVLNLTGNTVSLLEESNANTAYTSAMATSDTLSGDEKLYLKGGNGSLAVIDLFKSPGELERIRNSGWLINEANLIFHVDQTSMNGAAEPSRIYLYDFKNNRPVVDYYNDATSNKTIFDGILNKGGTSRGVTYKIRITNQIRNLIKNKDSTNVKLGLVVTGDINTYASYRFENQGGSVKQLPKSSVMSQLGTIIYGSRGSANVPEDKRLKLQIYYTKPN